MNYKKLCAAMAAVSFLLSGCEKIDNFDADFVAIQETAQSQEGNLNIPDGEAQSGELPAEEDTLTTYARAEEIPIPEGIDYLYDITPTADGGYICNGGYYEYSGDGIHIFRCNADFSDWSETVLVPLASYDGYYQRSILTELREDACYSLVTMENHSNMEPFKEGDDDYNWDLYHETWESDYYLCTYAADGTLEGKLQIEGLEDYRQFQGYDQFLNLYGDGEHFYLSLMDGTILSINADGTVSEAMLADSGPYVGIGGSFLTDRDGKTIYAVEGAETTPQGYYIGVVYLAEFDVNTGIPDEPFYSYSSEDFWMGDSVSSSGGCGDYRLFINEGYTLYGIKDDNTKEVVIDWDASDLVPTDVTPLADGSFIAYNDGKMCRITRKYASEVKDKQIITLGILGYTDEDLKDFIRAFNSEHDDYRLQTVLYQNSDGSYFGDPEGNNDALDTLKLAVVSDDAPDLIFIYEQHETFLKLGSRGVFCDLYEMMENDAETNRGTLLPNVLTAIEHPNGALYALPSGFTVSTIAIKSKFDTKENWTMDDMIALYDGADDIMYYWTTKQEMLRLLLMGTDFTDELNGTCSFDSPDFVKMLEFCNRYPLESTCPEKNYDDEVAMAKFDKWHTDSYYRYQNDEDYLYSTTFGAVDGNQVMASDWAYTKSNLGGDFTLSGFPSDNGKGGKITASSEMGIVSTCADKEIAWEVLKAYTQSNFPTTAFIGYSIYDETFEQQLDDEMYIWEWGERSDAEYYEDDSRVYPLTQEERDGLEEYLRGCDTYMMLDEKVENIIYEEAGMYFSGDRSAEDTAKMIQSRAALYLSEQS